MNKLFKLFFLINLILSFDSIAQKTDVRVEIFDLKEDVKKLQSENQKLSSDLSTSSIKYENRILDLGAKIEDLRFEINVLKRMLEQYRGVNNISPSESSSTSNGTLTEGNKTEKSQSKTQSPTSSQCSATTKKGTRCSRSARSNGLCWQHGG